MTSWKWDSSYDQGESIDWLIIRNGPITKYFSLDVLNDDLSELEKMRYQFIDLSTSSWTSQNAHKKIKEGFDFPDYYGGNRAAFDVSLDEISFTKFFWPSISFK